MEISAADIFAHFGAGGLLLEVLGNPEVKATRVAAVQDCQPGDLVFVDKKEFFDFVIQGRPSVVVTSLALKESFEESKAQAILIASNVALAHALLKQKYAGRDFSATGWEGTHSSAVVHPTAVLGVGTVVEPRAVIGPGVTLGDNCRVMAGAVVEHGVVMGNGCVIHPSAVIGFNSVLGNSVQIGASTVIGSEGYGFAQDSERRSHSIPQTGNVVLEDRVRVGAGCCIDRGSYRSTIVGEGTKIDNLCHIAHNVEIGRDCLLTAMCCIAGSTKIGNRVIASGQSGILDHLTVCDDVVLLHKAGVAKEILEPGLYAGTPTQPLSDYLKNTATLRQAHEMRKAIRDLEKKVASLLAKGS
jgi:UDP-3-O-[3-hydroxymyristoyl] glucosamine N-acyltransferase